MASFATSNTSANIVVDCNTATNNEEKDSDDGDDRLRLLPFEQNLMLDSFVSDVLFIMARGLALERLFLNHLHLYTDQRSTYFVINTAPEDEHFYLEKLRALNPDCPPKLITAEVLAKDRELIYQSGGIQFITSRILMVDLLKGRVPFDKVKGVLVYRAHELLFGFQASFILRLFREKKRHDFLIKAFTDSAERIVADGCLGQLQRLLNLLYVKRVIIVPRFHAEVKACFDASQPKITQMSIKLEPAQRKAQASLRDIIATCVRELKQASSKELELDPDVSTPTTSAASLHPGKLERDLSKRDVPLTDRQQRLVTDLRWLRNLFQKVEDLDPTNAAAYIHWLRTDKEIVKNNSGWIFTQSAATLFSNIDALCSLRDANGDPTISAPAKWSVFCTVLEEINAKLVSEDSSSPVLVLVSTEQLSRQLVDLVKFGQRRYTWMLARKNIEPSRRDSLALAPPMEPCWNPVNVASYDVQMFEKDRQDLLTDVKAAQKEEAKKRRLQGKLETALKEAKQPRLDRFGIQPFARPSSPKPTTTNGKSNKAKEKAKAVKQQQPAKRPTPIRIPLTRETMPSTGTGVNGEDEEEQFLPEDPFTSFYFHDDEASRASGNSINMETASFRRRIGATGDDGEEDEVVEDSTVGLGGGAAAEASIIVLEDNNNEEATTSAATSKNIQQQQQKDAENGKMQQQQPRRSPRFLRRSGQSGEEAEEEDEIVNRSIAGAARKRAERSIHIVDEFQLEVPDEEADELSYPKAKAAENNERAGNGGNSPLPKFNGSLDSMLVFLELGDRYKLINCLESLRPRHVVMYSQDIAYTRIVETFKAFYADHPLELYMLMYEESSEEERYLCTIQRELEAIESLIKEQGLLLVPREFDVGRDSVSQLRRLTMPRQNRRLDSRTMRAGALRDADEEFEAEMRPMVIVDMREFNSELPTVMYRRGIDLEAATLQVGDYILSPDICCERKSLDDLAQSLVNGRLFKQVEQMTKHYKRCILLVESTEKYRNRVGRVGAFQGELSKRAKEARQLLVMLVRIYPQLDILWSVSPAHSAELFEELKLDQPNPVLDAARNKRRAAAANDVVAIDAANQRGIDEEDEGY